MSKAFNPNEYGIKIRGGQTYIPVAARIVWFHNDFPEWSIETDPLTIDHDRHFAVFRCTIRNEQGRIMAQATKMEDKGGFGDFLEKAETGSVGRALAFLGYGVLGAKDFEEGERYADSPQPRKEPERDPRYDLLLTLSTEACRLEISDILDHPYSNKRTAAFTQTVCSDLGRVCAEPPTVEDIAFATENLARWKTDQKARAIADRKPAQKPPSDPLQSLLNALSEQAKLHGIGELAPAGDYATLSALARTICESVGRQPEGELTHDDMLVAVSTVGTWAEYQRAPIAQTDHPEDNLPELQDTDPPFTGGFLFPAQAPAQPIAGNYTDESNRGYAEPQGRKNARK